MYYIIYNFQICDAYVERDQAEELLLHLNLNQSCVENNFVNSKMQWWMVDIPVGYLLSDNLFTSRRVLELSMSKKRLEWFPAKNAIYMENRASLIKWTDSLARRGMRYEF